ncbi:MAG TPA: 4Fe-4S ferredoxin [Coriobacteriia bacterium]|jgi:protein NrfC|nr:MAG: 4Fe-4S ferredoxin iron-sulfur binding domain protein [Actinobacteria bacterium 66_15]HAL30801.1 4Fe-4S ferredoxin [Coriobacteriia bacterium]
MADNDIKTTEGQGYSRRQFFAGLGGVGVGALLGGFVVKGFIVPEQVMALPASEGYLLVDTKKCAGCDTCMLACSMVHYGRVNPALSRIQVTKNPFGKFPYDMEQVQCRQCPAPACVEACPTGANHVSEEFGNVRMVDESKCVGCERCVYACPFTPSRMQWNHEDKHAQKCDLCANTPYWNEEGGPGGKQACIESCPMRAISYTTDVPVQQEWGYMANLRNHHWGWLSLDTTDFGKEADFELPTNPVPPAAAPAE